jgi:hypothetical protein
LRIAKKFLRALALLLALPLAVPAPAQNRAPCRDVFPRATVEETTAGIAARFHLAVVKKEKAYFYQDASAQKGCPGAEGCQGHAYLVPGDKVVALLERDGWVCSYYRKDPKHKEHIGWLKADLLEAAGQEPVSRENWLAKWETADADIVLNPSGKPGVLKVTGDAEWHGSDPGDIHTGELDGEAKPEGDHFLYRDEGCEVRLTLMGEYLVAVDNGECGGVNVDFDGIYVKAPDSKTQGATHGAHRP